MMSLIHFRSEAFIVCYNHRHTAQGVTAAENWGGGVEDVKDNVWRKRTELQRSTRVRPHGRA